MNVLLDKKATKNKLKNGKLILKSDDYDKVIELGIISDINDDTNPQSEYVKKILEFIDD